MPDGGSGAPQADPDPFGTAALRSAVLRAWRGSPTRFREDANAEEDLARGGYRDRLVVELAQNAADAASRAGVAGRLLLRLRADRLEVSNTGAALDADGVASLAALRASAKRDPGTVGRFGVGFAAVVAVSDDVAVRSAGGGVRFSAERTREAVAAEPRLADEVARRHGQLPLLRLPFPDDDPPEPGYATTVALRLRDAEAQALVHRLLDDVDDALLLALPALCEVVVETGAHHRRVLTAASDGADVVVTDDGHRTRWRVHTAEGVAPPAALADRPVEERARPGWSVTWAVPLDDAGRPTGDARYPVLHAPTPTDEPLDLPALLLASFPLDPTRRHVARGPLTDLLVEEAAHAYADVVSRLAEEAGATALRLVPGVAPAGPLDGRLRTAVLARLKETLRLPAADPQSPALAVPDAVAIDPAPPEAIALLGPVLGGLVSADWSADRAAMDRLGVARLPLADALDALADLTREPAWWRSVYDALAGVEPRLLEGLPVPLVDGRTVRGPRSALLPGDAVPAADLAVLGHRVVHPDAVHPLLARLGAAEAEPARLLADPALLARLPEADDALTAAVLRTAGAAQLRPGEVAGLGVLPLPGADGSRHPAHDLLLPGSALAAVAGPEVPRVADAVVASAGVEALLTVGVLDRLRVARLTDVELDPDALAVDRAYLAAWADDVLDVVAAAGGDVELPPLVAEVPVVLGLDRVDDTAWPGAHDLLTDADVRRAVVERVRVLPVSGPAVDVPSPAAWWLREAPLLSGETPTACRLPDADPVLAGLYPTVVRPRQLDDAFLHAVGVRSSVADLLAEPDGPSEVLDRLADPSLAVTPEAAAALYAAVAALPEERWPEPPSQVRVPRAATSAVVPAGDVVVALAPHHLPLSGPAALAGSRRLAALLEVADSERLAQARPEGGARIPVPDVVRTLLAGAPETYVEHDDLVVGGVTVEWWIDTEGAVHASTAHGLARGLAWAAGAWPRRLELAEVLADPSRADELRGERAFDGWAQPEDG